MADEDYETFSFEAERSWPPNRKMTYRTKVELDSGVAFEYELAFGEGTSNVNLGSLMVDRIGGPSVADWRLREQLYYFIGMATVASGHVEAGMKRLLLVLNGLDDHFSLVDHTWTDLVKKLTLAAADTIEDQWVELRGQVRHELDLMERYKLKSYRDNIIHGYVWDYDMPMVLIGRFHRRSDGATLISSLDEIKRGAARLAVCATHLDQFLVGIWPMAGLETHDPAVQQVLDAKYAKMRAEHSEEADSSES